jgi:hypothetical protein
MFERLVSQRVHRKATKGQARIAGRLAVLIVDMVDSEIRTQLGIPAYRGDFVKSLSRSFGDSLRGYDVIAFCEQTSWRQELVAHFVLRDASISQESIRMLFGDQLVEQLPTGARIDA